MAKIKTGDFRTLNAAIKPIISDRGLAGTFGLFVSFGIQPVLAHDSITAPVGVPPTATHSSNIASTAPTFTHSGQWTHTGNNVTSTSTTNGAGNTQSSNVTSTHHTHNPSGSSSNSSSTNSSGPGSSNNSTSSSGSSSSGGSTSSPGSSSSGGSTSSSGSNSSGGSTNSSGSSSSGGSTGSSGSNSSGGSTSSSGSNSSGGSTSSSGSNSSGGSTTPSSNTANSQSAPSTNPTNHQHSSTATTSTQTASTGQVLNLQSSAATFTLGTLGNFKTVTIDVGGKIEQVTSTTKLTSAELLAADQALHSNTATTTQGLAINSQGIATGGEFTLTGSTLRTLDAATGGISSLTIPTQVTLNDKVKTLDILGSLTNNGSIVAESKSPTGSLIESTNLTNASGASITGASPLTLTATQTLTNAGTIKSTGDLTINTASLQNVASSGTPLIAAGHDLNINAPTINNSGALTASNNINLTSAQTISVTQTPHANLSAVGDINVRDSSYSGTGNVSFNGGDLLSKNLNIYAAGGEVLLNVGNVTGQLNGDVGAIHSNTQASTLILGNLNITGDPSFYNQGNLAVGGTLQDTNGVPLALVTTGNIVSNGGSLITGGGNLTLIAGANYSTNDGTTYSTGYNWNSILTINGASTTGGYIDLTGASGGTAPIVTLSTAVPNGVDGNGGNVTMVAYAGSGAGTGTVNTPASSAIITNGRDFSSTVLSTNGNVTVIGNGTSVNGTINILGSITADGAKGGGGIITLSTGAPIATGTTINNVASPYEIVNGQPYGTFTASSTLTGGNIQLGTVTGFQPLANSPQVGGVINVSTNGYVTINGTLLDQGINIQTGQNFEQSTNWTAGGISITTPGWFGQGANSVVTMDGEGGQYNITSSYVNFTGTTRVLEVNSAGSLNVTSNIGVTDYIGATGHLTVDNATFTGASTISVLGIISTPTNPDSPPGSGNLTFNSPGNNGLTITGPGGTITNSGTFTATAAGNILISPTNAPAINTTSNPNGWVFTSGGEITIPFNTLTAAPDPLTGNGGTVSLTYGGPGLNYPGAATLPFVITANAASSGTTQNGGTVTINVINAVAQAIGNRAGNFEIFANSGTAAAAIGGNISLTTYVAQTINPAFLSNTGTGTGGSLSLTSTSANIVVNGSLSEMPIGGSPVAYGNISLNTPGTASGFTVGAASNNGVTGNLIGDVTINAPTGVVTAVGGSITGNSINLTGAGMSNNGTIMGTNIGAEVTSTVTLTVSNFINQATGVIGAQVGTNGQSLISLISPTGNLQTTGTGTWDRTFGYSFVSAAGSVNMGTLFAIGGQNPVFDQLNISAKTSIAVANDALTTDGGATGKISLSFATLAYSNSTIDPLTLTANGSNSLINPSDGILVNSTGSATQTIGNTHNTFSLQAESGAIGGSVSFVNAGALVVNENSQSLNNQNGNLVLNAGTNLEIVGPIVQGTGSITLTSVAPTSTFVVGSASPVANGINGSISGGPITITENAIQVNAGSSIAGTGITLNTNSLLNNGTLSATAVNPAVPTPIAVIGNATTTSILSIVNNGTITAPTGFSVTTPQATESIAMSGTGTISSSAYSFTGFNINLGQLFSTPTSNTFDSLTINASGLASIATNDLKTIGNADTTNVISIITGSGLTYTNSGTTALTLDTRSNLGGGSVTYEVTNTGSAPVVVGNSAGQLTVLTSETQVNGVNAVTGNVTIAGSGGVTVNPTYLVTNQLSDASASTNITLTGLGTSNVLVSSGNAATGWANTLLGPMGNLNITTNSATGFYIGSVAVPVNGIYTSNPIVGGSITISNTVGAISLGVGLQGQAAGGSLDLTANGAITSTGSNAVISAPNVTLTSNTGTVGTSTTSIFVTTPTNATASSVTLSSPTGVYVTDGSAGLSTVPPGGGAAVDTLTLVASAPIVSFTANNAAAPLVLLPNGLVNSTTVTINAAGSTSSQGIETVMTIGNQTGVVTLNAGTGTITENPTFGANSYPPIYIEGTTVALTANGVTNTNPTNTNFLTIENALTYNGTMAAGQLLVNNNFFQNTLNAGTTNNFNYLTHGSLEITGVQTSSGNYNVTSWGNMFVDANVNSTGTVTLQTVSGGPIETLNNSVVTATTVNLSSDYGNLTVNVDAQTLNLNTTGVVNLTNTNANSEVFVTNAPTSFTLLSSGDLTVNSNISTTNGNILLESTNTTTGSVDLNNNVTLHASSTLANTGNVTITIGAPPTTPTAGTTPPNVAITSTGGGQVYFGSSTNPNGTINSDPPTNDLNASGRNIIFNSDGRTSAINLLGGDVITADPPVVGASPSTQTVSPVVATNVPVASASANFSSASISAFGLGTTSLAPFAVSAPIQSNLAAVNSQLGSGAVSVLSSFNSSNLVHADLSNGVNLSVPALSSNNSVSSTALQSSTGSSAFNTVLSALPTVSAETQASASSGITAGVNSVNNINALTKEPLMGEVSKKHHGHSMASDAVLSDSHKALDSGAMILCPDHDVTVDSRFGKVQVAAKSLVVMVATNSGLSIFNIHDDSRNSVMVVANGKTTDVYPGRHVTISNAKEDSFEQINPGLFIPHRNMRAYDSGTNKIYTSEFHIQSAIRGIEPLRALLASPDKDKQKMADKVYKTIAVLQVLTGKNGSFELLTPRPVTAYSSEAATSYAGPAQ